MNYTLTALPAGEGTYRIPSLLLRGVTVPTVTTLLTADGWTPFVDGESLDLEARSWCVRTSLHRCIAAYLRRHGVNPALNVRLEG
jgi:hypothetical protein